MFYLAGTVLALFLAILLVTKKGRTKADLILALWLFFIGMHLVSFYIFIIAKAYSMPNWLGLELPLPLVHGPFLFLYTGVVTGQINSRPIHLLHFLPFVLSYYFFIDFFMLMPQQKITVYENKGAGFTDVKEFLLMAIMVSGVIYVAWSLLMLRKHRQMIQQYFSSVDKINLAWLRYLIYGIGVIWGFVFIGMELWTFGAVVVFIFFLGYFGIRQVGIFSHATPDSKGLPEIDIGPENAKTSVHDAQVSTAKTSVLQSREKYVRSGLRYEVAQQIHHALQEAIHQKKLFANSELSLTDLAEYLGVNSNNLSQVINTFENKNFYDYINQQRIEEFKRLAGKPENHKFTLLALAHDCGFNSKTSFNRNFKNVTGLSPSQYLKQNQIQVNA